MSIINKIFIKIIDNRLVKIRKTLDEHEKIKKQYLKDGNSEKSKEIDMQIKLDKEMLELVGNLYLIFLY
jgi:hypothetical protein